jgi:fibronectin type 3 domain-containing protein
MLSWSPSSSSGVVSYNVYRSAAASGPFTRIGNVSGTTFTDSSVQNGQTYFYTVTSVDSNDVESSDPTPVSATVPA